MTTCNDQAAGSPCWIDLMTSDTGRSRQFYGELLGWQAQEASEEFGGYFMFTRDGQPVAGAMPKPAELDQPDEWSVYLAVSDATAALKVAAAAGGQIRVEPMPIADLGWSAVISDPSGARVGLWQAAAFAGFAGRGEIGAPGWFELVTGDYETAVGFYRDVFDWDVHAMSDSPNFRYSTLGESERASAGLMDAAGFLPPGAPGKWWVYFAVADVDSSVARLRSLGGTEVEAGQDTPFGRLVTVADPTGALFKLLGPVTTPSPA